MNKSRCLIVVVLATGFSFACQQGEKISGVGYLDPNATVSVSISPPPGAVEVCFTVQLHALVQGGNGATLTPDSVTWHSSNNIAAPISASGLLTGLQLTPSDTVVTTVFIGGVQHQVQTVWSVQGTGGVPAPCH